MSQKVPLIIDNGTHTIKAGLSSEPVPKVIFQNIIGKPKKEKDYFVSKRLKEELAKELEEDVRTPPIILKNPMSRGVVQDFDHQEVVWNNIYDELELKSENHPVLLTIPPNLPEGYLSKLTEIWFEKYNIPSMFLALPPIMSLHSKGETTGLVLDCGHGLTQIVAVFEGYKVEGSVIKEEIGGYDVTNYFSNLLRRRGYVFTSPNELELIREAKEDRNYMYVCEDLKKENYLDERGEVMPRKKTLPDGTNIDAAGERYKAPEILFRPSILGREHLGMAQLMVKSVKQSDLDIRSTLYRSMFITGGSSLFQGFCERLLRDVRNIVPRDRKIEMKAPPERIYSAWLGAKAFSDSSVLQELSTSKKTYRESGTQSFLKNSFI